MGFCSTCIFASTICNTGLLKKHKTDQLLSSPQFVFCPFIVHGVAIFFPPITQQSEAADDHHPSVWFCQMGVVSPHQIKGVFQPWYGCCSYIKLNIKPSDLTVLQKTKVKPNRCSPYFIQFIYPSKVSQLSEAFEMWIGCQKPSFLH